jgi:hypothetical protein
MNSHSKMHITHNEVQRVTSFCLKRKGRLLCVHKVLTLHFTCFNLQMYVRVERQGLLIVIAILMRVRSFEAILNSRLGCNHISEASDSRHLKAKIDTESTPSPSPSSLFFSLYLPFYSDCWKCISVWPLWKVSKSKIKAESYIFSIHNLHGFSASSLVFNRIGLKLGVSSLYGKRLSLGALSRYGESPCQIWIFPVDWDAVHWERSRLFEIASKLERTDLSIRK